MYDRELDNFIDSMLDLARVELEPDFEEFFEEIEKTCDVDPIDGFIEIAKTGNEEAQLYLGLFYLFGIHIHRNYDKAAMWLGKSARQGNETAQYYYGVCYSNGLGVDQDLDEAIKWVRKSVRNGFTDGEIFLTMLENLSD